MARKRHVQSAANRRREDGGIEEDMDAMKQAFREFIFSTNTDGSGKTDSCVRALEMALPKSQISGRVIKNEQRRHCR